MKMGDIEIWRPIKGYGGKYEISSQGRVRSLWRNTGKGVCYREKYLTKSKTKEGYQTTYLYKNKSPRQLMVSRLVADAFICNPLNLPEVNHIDENLNNNNVNNLEWCTRSYNTRYGTRTDRQRDRVEKPVLATDVVTGKIKKYMSVRKAAKDIGCKPHTISQILTDKTGRHQTAYGFKFEYAINSQTHRRNKVLHKKLFEYGIDKLKATYEI
ncbi:MAG: NUMOD4 domain-containing protein [Liquorilactobacillus hordei]|uniref:NUMOD4 domain-containing protein n=1 Tax=Liquorilactobacillus hordei TaxID=468911 RepID=UPI0039EC15C8